MIFVCLAAQHVILGALPFASMLDTLRDKVRASLVHRTCSHTCKIPEQQRFVMQLRQGGRYQDGV